ncbi:MAG: glycosyl hydrolase, partial [Solirubrobacteraceae bacterium]
TAAEMAAQRLRWATDSLRLFFWDNPFLKRGLTTRQKVHYAQTTGVYYLATAFQITFLVCPALSLLFGLEVIDPRTTLSYVVHLAVFIVPLATMLIAFAGWRGALRLVQMQSFLAPVFCLAAWRAARMRPGRKAHAFSGVTRKSKQQQVNRITLVQHGLFALLLASVGYELAGNDGIQWGAVLWALVMAGTLSTQNSMVSMRWEISQSARIALTAPVLVAGALVLVAIWSPFPGAGSLASSQASITTPARSAKVSRPPPPPRKRLLAPRHGVYLGAYDPDVAFSSARGVSLRRYGPAKLRILHRFQQWWGRDRYLDKTWARQVHRAGAAPMSTWEPWRKPPGSVTDSNQHPGLLRDIARGRYDPYLRRWARDAAAFRHPMIMRFMHEMNGSWYPWRAAGNGNTPADFKAAFRHVHRVFDRHGATNVSWVFSIDTLAGGPPTSKAELDTYYPGDRYVDWIGLSGFNWGPESAYSTERSFLSTFKPTVDVVSGFRKPVMLSEIGTSAKSADPAAWLQSALDGVRELPAVRSVVWFDADTPDADFRLRGPALRVMRRAGRTRELTPPFRTRTVAR